MIFQRQKHALEQMNGEESAREVASLEVYTPKPKIVQIMRWEEEMQE